MARERLKGGNHTYENAYASFVWSFSRPARDQMIKGYEDTLKLLWYIVLLGQRMPLRIKLDKIYGLEQVIQKMQEKTATKKIDSEAAKGVEIAVGNDAVNGA